MKITHNRKEYAKDKGWPTTYPYLIGPAKHKKETGWEGEYYIRLSKDKGLTLKKDGEIIINDYSDDCFHHDYWEVTSDTISISN